MKTNDELTINKDQEPPDDQQQNETIVERKLSSPSVLGFIGFYGSIGILFFWINDKAQKFLIAHIWPIGVVFTLLAILVITYLTKRNISEATTKRKIGLVIFVVIPVLLLLVGAVFFMPDEYEVAALRSVFLLIVCLLPALLYYLFIASRKHSLLQEYITNISRFGLLERQPRRKNSTDGGLKYESENDRRIRVMSYIQRFEVIYGSIEDKLAKDILEYTNPDNKNPKLPEFHQYAKGNVGGIFTPETTFPVVIATLLIWLGWLLILPPWGNINLPVNQGPVQATEVPDPAKAPLDPISENPQTSEETPLQRLSRVFQPNKVPVHFAFLGAYFFSLQMLFRRYVRKDLRGNAYIAVTLRIILAVIGTWAVLQAFDVLVDSDYNNDRTLKILLVVSFVIGAFPPIAWQVIQAAFRKVTGARFLVPSLRSAMPVSDLDGLTVWHQTRLEEEDIENIPNMATADLVELILTTRFPPDRIVDWVDQAILYTQLGPDKKADDKNYQKTRRQILRSHGIRTASDLIDAYERSKKHKDVSNFEKILSDQGRSQIRTLVDTLSTNPIIELIKQWRHVTAAETAAA